MRTFLSLILASALVGCGSPPVVPLVSGSVTGSYDGTEFNADNGIAIQGSSNSLILLGNGNLYCGIESSGDPPTGYNAAIYVPGPLEVEDHSGLLVEMYENVSSFEGVGTSTGSLSLTEVTDAVVAGEISFDYTDDDGRAFSVSGTFEVERCPDAD